MKDFLRKCLPKPILNILKILASPVLYLKHIYLYFLIKKQQKKYVRIVEDLKRKKIIKVAFFALSNSVWKYDYLYKLMLKHPRFDPVIVICPIVNYGKDNMLVEMAKCFNRFKDGNYKIILTYNKESNSFLDVKKEINPDIIFYTNPYEELIDKRYYITKYLDKLTCYVSYNYGNSNLYQMFHNLPLHNLAWRLFAETNEHRRYSVEHAINKGQNVVVTGYPGLDLLLDNNYKPKNCWKISDSCHKKIIWAPHHTFAANEVVQYSCFLVYYQFMLDMANKYKDEIQIAFKPHPLLRVKLNTYWGKERTDEYYSKWDKLSNGMLVEGDYIDLFLTSDAMIHDCGSFIIEYLYTKKPVMRTYNGISYNKEFNPFVIEALSAYYHAKSEKDIEEFIKNLISGNDSLKLIRDTFYYDKLEIPGCKLPSQNILDYILKNLS